MTPNLHKPKLRFLDRIYGICMIYKPKNNNTILGMVLIVKNQVNPVNPV